MNSTSSKSEHLQLAVEDGVASITINRPDALNAMNVDMLEQLPVVLEELATDDSVRVVMVRGTGDRAFCAGGDIRGLGDDDAELEMETLANRLEFWSTASLLLHTMPKPTVACINGIAAGAGMSLALACDLRIGCSASAFNTAFARVGMSGDFGGSYSLTQLLGPARAKELYFMPRTVDAEEALGLGLLNVVVDDSDLDTHCAEVAQRLASISPLALKNMKQNLNTAQREDLESIIVLEARNMIETANSHEAKEATRRFFNKD